MSLGITLMLMLCYATNPPTPFLARHVYNNPNPNPTPTFLDSYNKRPNTRATANNEYPEARNTSASPPDAAGETAFVVEGEDLIAVGVELVLVLVPRVGGRALEFVPEPEMPVLAFVPASELEMLG